MKKMSRSRPTKKQPRLPPLEEDLLLAPLDDSLLVQSDDSFSIDSLASFQMPRGIRKEEESVLVSDFDDSATLQSVDVLSLAGSVVRSEENILGYSQVKSEDYDDRFQIRELPLDSQLWPPTSTSTDDSEQTTLRNINHLTIKAELSALSINNEKEFRWQELDLQGADDRETMEKLRREMKKIDEEVRVLTSKKNKLKYLLRKQEGTLGQGEGEPEPTKQCPCCNKDISKLCFRCEHTYCEPEQCARKKKQLLNARMLSKMKEKKGSKKDQLKDKKDRKAKAKALPTVQEEESEQSFDSYSSSQSMDSSTESKSRTKRLQDLPVIRQQTRQEPSSSFSDINTSSFLNFTLSAANSSLYFEQQSAR